MATRRRSFQGSSISSADPSAVWWAWTSPSEWPGGVIQKASIDGEFVVGANITAKAKGGPTTTHTVTSVDPPRGWVGVSKFPGVTMTYEHEIEVVDGGTKLTERAVMSGPLAGVAALLIGKSLAKGFNDSTARIAEVAEAGPKAG
ncbi:SRPBCC domain-containing protein [Mycolicibacterium stellerae]|uniref:SRPBCC domain-containing protein n=1 Tax=Mycolicibacterium stellerae TaxID=2358193 RepID=UPI000F0B80D8|nr:hypothetical protein [Mycolicibacterium stellerae]